MTRSLAGHLAALGVMALSACGLNLGTSTVDSANGSPGPAVTPSGGPVPPADGGALGTSPDGATRPGDSAPPPTPGDGASPPSGNDPANLPCGASVCHLPAEVCCVTRSNGTVTHACVAGAACPPTAGGSTPTTLHCASGANCAPGTVCCVSASESQAASTCRPACLGGEAQLCDPAAAVDECAPSEPCSTNHIGDWRLPVPYATCGGKED